MGTDLVRMAALPQGGRFCHWNYWILISGNRPTSVADEIVPAAGLEVAL